MKKKFVIYLCENDTKVYIKVSDQGASSVPDKLSASAFPNRVAAASIVAMLKPAIKKQGLPVQIGVECCDC